MQLIKVVGMNNFNSFNIEANNSLELLNEMLKNNWSLEKETEKLYIVKNSIGNKFMFEKKHN